MHIKSHKIREAAAKKAAAFFDAWKRSGPGTGKEIRQKRKEPKEKNIYTSRRKKYYLECITEDQEQRKIKLSIICK